MRQLFKFFIIFALMVNFSAVFSISLKEKCDQQKKEISRRYATILVGQGEFNWFDRLCDGTVKDDGDKK